MEIIALVVVGTIALIYGVSCEIEKREWRKERGKLIDRIMAKTLPEYVEAETARENAKVKVVSVEELKRELEPEREQGIPV